MIIFLLTLKFNRTHDFILEINLKLFDFFQVYYFQD